MEGNMAEMILVKINRKPRRKKLVRMIFDGMGLCHPSNSYDVFDIYEVWKDTASQELFIRANSICKNGRWYKIEVEND